MEKRSNDPEHPSKKAVLSSRRKLQKIARDEESAKSIAQADDLMDTLKNNPTKIYDKMKKARGENVKGVDIPYLETLSGKYTGESVLEGFASNTEILCNDKENSNKFDNEICKMFEQDNMIIIDITAEEEVSIPQMDINQLKDILFKKLKLNKACDIFKLTVEHLRNAGDDSLLCIL